ncbi:hypothetical protein [Kamptonema sp. PCC 6506]|uniref:hypothetical protein n=1 Tax=Kamptonema sp. PCC 6506 TaxID=272129 RepID=UPI0001DAC7E6|nr:hypothetical protein [Kamptonema sp. PCC 6506]CBN54932.1 hypothetical protein OSCI_1210002 [Kamptonema sp. PCC 6506]
MSSGFDKILPFEKKNSKEKLKRRLPLTPNQLLSKILSMPLDDWDDNSLPNKFVESFPHDCPKCGYPKVCCERLDTYDETASPNTYFFSCDSCRAQFYENFCYFEYD